ncbi:hypothetical protein [Streptomyces sp. ACA25]|uniref:hypothetical protein n=1 Tax=Streptomyces sp. ACA25 TaxID=3022596 RepID=UPI002FE1446C
MMWVWIAVIFLVCGGGAWVAETVRDGQRNRHEQRMELLRAEERRRSRLEAAQRPPEPVCGCGHHLAKHDRRGICHEVVQVPTGWDADRRPTGFEPGQCSCQQYVGPQPLSQIYADEITDREAGVYGGPGGGADGREISGRQPGDPGDPGEPDVPGQDSGRGR